MESQSEQMRRVNSEEVEVVVVEYIEEWADGLEKLEEDYAMLQKGMCGTNAELSTAWGKIDKLKADLIKLAIYVGMLSRDCYNVSTFLHVHGYTDPWTQSRKVLDELPEDVRELLEKYR